MMIDLDQVAFEKALGAFKRKMDDINSNYPTEDPREGGGPVGYAITAYLEEMKTRTSVRINVNKRMN
jgi:hypothetical protein